MRNLVLLCLILPLAALGAPPASPSLEGAWEGALDTGALKLRLVAKFRRGPDHQGWQATLDSVDQGARDLPVDQVKLDGANVTLVLSHLGASYEARLEDGEKMVGTWKQGGHSLPLELKKTARPSSDAPRPQEPKGPLPYDALDVTVDAGPGVKLACTLTRPRGPGRFPAVVLVTGSGPQDRDEAIMGHRPFLVIADALTRKGIAVQRCDDRGIGKSTGDFKRATTFDFVDDALASVSSLKARSDIDAAHIGIVGHSEGGVIAPIAASRSKDVAFIVLLAGTGLTGEDLLYLQGAALAKAMGQSDAAIRKNEELQRRGFAVLKAEKDNAVARKKLQAIWEAVPEDVLGPWFRTFLTLDPRVFLKQVKVPVLALNGERDLQVPPGENLRGIRQALKGNPDVTLTELPGLNHLFQTCKTGLPQEYAALDETFSPTALDLMADWIGRHARAH